MQLKAKRSELLKKHRCAPWITLTIPLLAQAPVFMGLSTIFLRAAKEPGSVLREESFFTLTSLAHPDTTMAFPVLLGLISLATVETSHWFMIEKRGRPLEIARPSEKGKVIINPRRYIKGMMRGLSLGRIILAAVMPGVSNYAHRFSADTPYGGLVRRNLLVDISHFRAFHKLDLELYKSICVK